MGYNTTYSLKLHEPIINPIQVLCEENEDAAHCLTNEGDSNESGKWYDHEQDLQAISTRFPNHVFELRGEGEESGDVWVKYFKNGKVQASKAEIRLEPFDESKLI